MSYQSEGSLTTDKRTVDETTSWDSTEDFEDYQEKDGVDIDNGVLKLSEITIPESVGHRWNAPDVSESDGSTVDPWPDTEGSLDLEAVGTPSLQETSVNNVDAVDLNGSDEAYDYIPNLSGSIDEPCTIIWAIRINSLPSSDIRTLWRDENSGDSSEILIRTNNDDYRLNLASNGNSGSESPSTGDHIITLAIDDTDGVLRIDGSDDITVSSSSGLTVLESSDAGYFYGDHANTRRYLDCEVVECVIHPDDRLSGSDLSDEEGRLEEEANMNVL